eukprot:gene2494-2533_t
MCILALSGPLLAQDAAPVPAPKPDLAYGAYQMGLYISAFKEATKRIEADPNDAPAMTLIGQLYLEGLGVRLNEAEAARWFNLAAARGNAQAQFALGAAKLEGKGIPKDKDGAKRLFELAAAQNNAGALYNLGIMALEDAAGAAPVKAAQLFQQAAELGDLDACYSLALLYKNGLGVEKNLPEAVKWLAKAAQEKHVNSMIELGLMQFNGLGTERDETSAARWFLKAAELNNAIGQNRIARLLAAGRGVPVNKIEAAKWHVLARAQGEQDAWLDGVLNSLNPDEKAKVSALVLQRLGQ